MKSPDTLLGWIAWAVGLLVGTFVLILVLSASWKQFHRYQQRADANNQARVAHIQLRKYEALIQQTIKKAEIRKQEAIGIKNAQTEIAKTLTNQYIQFELVHALEAIAASGKNNSVLFIPTTTNGGIPTVFDTSKLTSAGMNTNSK